MQAILDWLSGRKAYIIAGLTAIFNFGIAVGWWLPDNAIWDAVNYILAALFGMALRAGVSKSGPSA